MEKLISYIEAQQPAPMSRIATDLGVSRPFLYDLVKGKRKPSLGVAVKIAKATDGAVPLVSWSNLADVVSAAQSVHLVQQ